MIAVKLIKKPMLRIKGITVIRTNICRASVDQLSINKRPVTYIGAYFYSSKLNLFGQIEQFLNFTK